MNKILKIWILSFALVWAFIYGITWASASTTNQAKVTLTDWSNSCTWTDYDFGSKTVSTSIQTGTASWQLSCTFGNSATWTVTYGASNLSATWWQTAIPAANIKMSASPAVQTAWNVNATSSLTSPASLDTPKTVYTKDIYKIGSMTQANNLTLTIPANQPAGTYTGTLTITVSP